MSGPRGKLTDMDTTDDRTRADDRAAGTAASAPVTGRAPTLPPDHPLAVLRRHRESRGAHWLLSAVHATHALEDAHEFAARHAEHIVTPHGSTLAEADDLRSDLDSLEDDDLEWLTDADIALALVELRKSRVARSATAAELLAVHLAELLERRAAEAADRTTAVLAATLLAAELTALAIAAVTAWTQHPPPPTLEALTTSTLTAAPPASAPPVPGARRAVLVTAC